MTDFFLSIIIGPMFSGKTSRLIDIYKREEFCSQHPIVINYSGDNRYSDHETHMSSHDSIKIPCIRTTNLSDIFDVGLYLLMKSTRKDDSKFLENIIVSTPDDDNTLSFYILIQINDIYIPILNTDGIHHFNKDLLEIIFFTAFQSLLIVFTECPPSIKIKSTFFFCLINFGKVFFVSPFKRWILANLFNLF